MKQAANQTDQTASPFHPGERAVQDRAGVREEAETRGRRMLTPDLNPRQAQFFRELPFLLCAHLDEDGMPWAGLLTGEPGFVAADSDSCVIRPGGNPTGAAPRAGQPLGLLGIELATRRRNRINGTVVSRDAAAWHVAIDQGYGNCPKYINERPWPAPLFAGPYTLETQPGLGDSARVLATSTDTFFIATASGRPGDDADTQARAWGADISHRGGEAGFLREEGGRLVFDDYPGNNMFNTLGNLARDPRCGLLVLDFQTGDIAQLAATGETVHRSDGRSVHLTVLESRFWRRGHAGTGGTDA